MFASGARIGNYEIAARIGPGGMGVVYLARRVGVEGFSRAVALKIVHEHLAKDTAFVQMFVREALLSARIHHPNVVHVEEFGHDRDTYFLAMEYVRGASLSALVGALGKIGRQVTPALAVAIAMQVADGLHAAHEARGDDGELLGVVHRDVSPQNVLLSETGQVKLIDFGVAKARGLSADSVGGLKGKLRYMPPEQARARDVDRRADVYALGVVLWELLVGEPLFAADSELELLDRVRFPNVPPPTSRGAEISEALERAVLHALAVEPDDRPETALAFRDEILRAQPGAASIGSREIAELLLAAKVPIATAAVAEHSADDQPTNAPLQDAATRNPPVVLTTLTATRKTAPPPEPIALAPRAIPEASEAASVAQPTRRRTWLAIASMVLVGMAAIGAAASMLHARASDATPHATPPLATHAAVLSAAPSPEPAAPSAPALANVAPDAGVIVAAPEAPSIAHAPAHAHTHHRAAAGLLPSVPLASDPGR